MSSIDLAEAYARYEAATGHYLSGSAVDAWGSLSEADRAAAVAGIDGFVANRLAAGRTIMPFFRTYLRERMWALTPPAPPPPSDRGGDAPPSSSPSSEPRPHAEGARS